MSLWWFLAVRADTEELNLVRLDPIACVFSNFSGQLLKQVHFRVDYPLAFGADEMRVRVGFVPIVTIAAVRKADFKKFIDVFKQVDCFVDRRQAGRWKIDLDLGIDLLDARVLVAEKKRLEDGDPLRRDAEFTLAELCKDFIQAVESLVHAGLQSVRRFNGE